MMGFLSFSSQCTIVLSLLLSTVWSVVVIPKPNGPFNVSIATTKLVDRTRLDPFASSPQHRAVMISIFHPVHPSECAQPSLSSYMPPATAAYEDHLYSTLFGIPNNTFASLRLQVCDWKSSKLLHSHRVHNPIVLFSPALGTSRHFYNAIAQSVASSGYSVVTIDHPYDADIVEFPDGSYILGLNLTDSQILVDVATRAQDVSFVLDQLIKPSVMKQLIPRIEYSLDPHVVGMFGHSLGGATAASAMLNDTRIAGGLNFDGTFFDPVVQQGLNRPFLLWGSSGKYLSADPSWLAIWQHLRGWKLQLELEDSQHYTFSDLPLLVEVTGLADKLPPEAIDIIQIGTIRGIRALEIVSVYVTAFFDFALKGRNSTILDGPSAKYPEVEFIS